MQARRSRSALLACTALAVLSLSTGALAQDAANGETATGETTTLQPVVVKGKRIVRRPGSVEDTPLAVQTTAEQLRREEINSHSDISRLDPSVQYSPSDKGFVIRGMAGNRVTTLIDDIPQPFLSNFSRAGSPVSSTTNADGGATAFSFNSVSTLDIVKGADSSRAGSGALGGAIVLRTLEPEDLIKEGRDWGGLGKATYDSANKGLGGSVAVAKRFDDTSVLFQGSYLRGHETKSTGMVGGLGYERDEANPANLSETNLLFKVRRELEGGHKIGVTAEHYNRDLDTELLTLRDGGTSGSRAYDDFFGFDESRRDRISLDYQLTEPGGFFDSIRSSIYWQNVKRDVGNQGERLSNPTGDWYRSTQLEEQSVGIASTFNKAFETGNFSHDLTIRGNFSYFWAESYTAGTDGCVRGTYPSAAPPCGSLHVNQSDMPDVNGARLGINLDDKMRYGDSAWSVTPGLAFDWFNYSPQETAAFSVENAGYVGMPDSKSGARLSPKLLVGYDVSPNLELFAQASMAYRAPNVNELYLRFAGSPYPGASYLVLGNPDLKSETGTGFELGGNYDVGDSTLRVVGFYNRYRNFIDTRDFDSSATETVTEYYNRARVRVAGLEVSASHTFDNGLHLNGSLSYTNAKDMDTDEAVRTVVPFKAVTGIGYSQDGWGVDLTGIFASAMRKSSSGDKFNAPGYGVANLTAWWEPEGTEGLRIQAGVYNIFDKQYWNGVALRDATTTAPANNNSNQPRAFYSEPGRSFRVSLTKTF